MSLLQRLEYELKLALLRAGEHLAERLMAIDVEEPGGKPMEDRSSIATKDKAQDLPEDAPFLGQEALSMVAAPPAPQPPEEERMPTVLGGSLEQRFAVPPLR